MTDLTPIVGALITLMGAIVTVFVIPLIKAKLSAEKRETLMAFVEIGVMAAEQLAKAGVINKEERKQHVLDFLNKNGFNVDLDSVEEMIESVVITLPPLIDKE